MTPSQQDPDPVPLSFACTLYDRMVPLCVGRVRPAGFDLKYIHDVRTRSIFDHMAGGLAFDAAELSLSEYICGIDQGDRRLVAIPVFPSRVFRHGFICVHRNAGIKTPRDLAGKRIGVQLYTMTAAVFIRGVLMSDYGVDLSAVQWVQGAVDQAGKHGNPAAPPLLRPVNLVQNDSGRSLDALLEAGELDAYIGARLPASLGRGRVERLFPDFKTVEIDYYRRTGIFPAMHVIVLRRDLVERHPAVLRSLYDALCTSKELARERLFDNGTLATMLPWQQADIEEMRGLFADGDPWPYGIEKNRPTLNALLDYLFQQGMSSRRLAIDDLFAPAARF